MKKHLILFLAAISTSFFVSCDSTNDDFNPPNYVTFAQNEMGFAVNENTSDSFEVTIFTANETSSDRTFTINVDESSTINADSYSIPETVTVPGGTNEATFTVEISDTSISNDGETLVLSLGDEEGLYTGDPLEIEIARICEFVMTGDFLDTSEWFEAEFPVEIVAGAEPGQYVIQDLFSEGSDITFTVNEDYSITVPKQKAWVHPDYGQASVQGVAGSKVEPCNREFTLMLRHTVAAGSFGTYAEVFTPYVEEPTEGEGDGTDGEGTDGDGTDGDGSGE